MFPVSDRFLDVITGTHHAVVRALLLTSTQFGPTPEGADLPILSGDVKFAATADNNSTLELTVPGDYWEQVQPYGAEVWVARGVAFGDGTQELVPLGYFRIDEVDIEDAPYGPVRLTCSDRISQIKQNRVLYPFQVPVGYTHRQLFERLVNGRVAVTDPINSLGYAALIQGPAIPILWNGYDPDRYTIDGGPVVENSTYDFMSKLADDRACVLRFDEFGQLNVDIRDPDPDSAPVYAITPGRGGNRVKASRKTTRDATYNIVVAYGSDPASPTGYQLAYNKDPNSPLRWDSQYGAAPRYYASPLLRTPQAAADAAATVLSHYTGLPTTLGLWTVPNPAIRPQDAVSAKITGLAETHIVDTVTVPLSIAGAGPVEIATKTVNQVVIPEQVPDGTGSGSGGTDAPTPAQILQEKCFEITSTAENSTVQWWNQFGYLEDIGDGRGYTCGIAGFTSATGDLLEVVQSYTSTKPGNVLAPFIPGLQTCANAGMGGTASSLANSNLGTPFKNAWTQAAADTVFQTVQINYRNQVYWTPAFNAAVADGVGPLGLAIYYDTSINHGPGVANSNDGSFDDIRSRTTGTKPSAGGSENTWLTNWLSTRSAVLTAWGDNPADGRIHMFTVLLGTGNLTLTCPFTWSVYGDSYTMTTDPMPYGWAGGSSGGGSVTFPNPGVAHNIGSAPGQNSFNIGIGFDGDPTYGTTHHDFTRDEIAAGLTVPGYYELNPAGEVLMSSHPGGGKTSNNTSYSRVEYRELERDGTTKMAFNPSVGRHYVKGRSEVDALASAKPQMVLAQMHDASNDTAMVYINNATQVLAKVNGTSIGTLGTHTVGGPVHDWMIEVVDGTINFYWDDLTTPKLSSTAFKSVTAGQYFKAGSYMQWNLSNGDATIGKVRLVGLEHWHSQTPLSSSPWPQPARPAGTGGTGGTSGGGTTGSAGFLAQLFVATTGSDSNPGTSKTSPKKTIAAAISAASPGNTISVAAGTYTGNVVPSQGGTSGNYITVRSETPRGAIISGSGSGNQSAVEINHGFLRFQDFTITGTDSSGVRYGVMITADDVEIKNCHIYNICRFLTEGTGFQGGGGIDFEGSTHANISLDGNEIHHIGPAPGTEQLVHGLYLSGDCTNVTVTNNLIYDCEDFGIQIYPTSSSSGIKIINNTISGCGRGILQGKNGTTRNNIVYNCLSSNYDIQRESGQIISNNFSGGGGNTTGVTGVAAGVDVKFNNITGLDFRLQPTSPALNAGTATDAPPRDIVGTLRPQGAGIDAGCYEMPVTTGGTTGGGTGGTTGGSTGTGSTGGAGNAADGVEAAKLLGWGSPLSDSDEFDYTGAPKSNLWSLYDGPGHAGNGTRDPSAWNVANGILTCTGTAGGSTGGMSHSRSQKFMRVEWRVRTYSINPKGSGHRYHPVLIDWPTSDQWPQGGEFDFYECDCDSGLYEAYLHIPGNDGSAQEYVKKACDISQWHNIAFEWSRNGCAGWLDGQQVFNFPGFKQPPGPMQLTCQLDNFFGSGMEPAVFQAMWCRIYTPPA